MKIEDLVILVGGRGTRLGTITKKTPKPLVKIIDKPFLDHLLKRLIKYNFKKIYLLCSYKKEMFFELFHKKKIHNSKIICIDEGLQKGTGGGLYNLRNKIKKNFILINGDTFFNIDFNKILNESLGNSIIKMCLVHKNKTFNNKIFTNIHLNKNKKIFFLNKKSSMMNGGIYLVSKIIFKYVKNKKLSLENDIISNLIHQNKVSGEFFNKEFIDIGSKKKLFYLKKNVKLIKNKCLFLDRDGVINKQVGYVLDYKKFEFLPGVKKAIKYANENDYLVIIITNQSAIGRSWMSIKKLNNIHSQMQTELINYNKSRIDDIFYSPYYENSRYKKYRMNKNDRKPGNGMIIKAIKKWNIDIKSSLFIGDQITDKQASVKSGLKFFFKNNNSLYKQIKEIL